MVSIITAKQNIFLVGASDFPNALVSIGYF
jgi:hypothetical protein